MTNWVKAGFSDTVISSFCKNTTFTVQGLTEGQEYLFRILAANVNGTGPPLDGVNPIKAKAPYDVPGEVNTSANLSSLFIYTKLFFY